MSRQLEEHLVSNLAVGVFPNDLLVKNCTVDNEHEVPDVR